MSRQSEPNRKIALKKAFANLLPEGIAYQKKKGFPIPSHFWLQHVYADHAKDQMGREGSFAAEVFPRDVRLRLAAQAIAGDLPSQYRVWSLIILNKWAEKWL